MRNYLRAFAAFPPDVKRFLAFNVFGLLAYGVYQVVFNLYLVRLGMREDDIGIISAVQTLSMAAGGIVLGVLLNRFGAWLCTTAGLFLFLMAAFALAFAESRLLLIALSLAYGFGLQFLFNTTMPFILEWCGPKQRAQAGTIALSLASISLTIGSLVGGLLPALAAEFSYFSSSSLEAYRWTLVVGNIICAFGLIPLFRMTSARAAGAPVPANAVVVKPSVTARKQARSDLFVFVAVGGVLSLGVGMVIPFYNVFLESKGADTQQVGLVFAISGACAAVIGLGSQWLGHRFGSIWAASALRFASAPAIALLIIFPNYSYGIAAYLFRQSTISMAWPLESSFIGELLPPRSRARAFGLRSTSWNFGYSFAAVLGGRIIVRTGYDWTFVSMAFFVGLAALMHLLYFKRHPSIRAGDMPSALPFRRTRIAVDPALAIDSTPSIAT